MSQPHSYTPEEQAFGKAAVLRYGPSVATRVIEQAWETHPHRSTLINWRRDESVVVTDAHREFWQRFDEEMAQRAKARVLPTFEKAVDALEAQLDHPGDMDRMAKVQGLTISVGILYDKITGAGRYPGTPMVGTAGVVNLMIVAPASEGAARPIVLESP